MNQHKVILSIGSNQGNRFENINNCIELIHKKLATVIKVSALYQTPSWGFESEPFYNCALLVHTNQKPEDLLEGVLAIEKELGRVRSHANQYQARIIDIDIIAYNQEVIRLDNLEVPHPRMQDRRFVLQPMTDLNTDFIHPILQKNTQELLKDCVDISPFSVVGKLKNPLARYNLEQINSLIIEGNIGAGKTTLATRISEDFDAKLVLEGFADNPFLPKFYEDQSRYAFPLEMSFLADRYQQLSDDLAQLNLFKKLTITDYFIIKSLIFARVTLQEDELRLYKRIFDIMYKEISKPDLYVYLYQNTSQLLRNIKKRGRSYEQQIPPEYLDSINLGYLDFVKQQKDLNVLVIDVSDKDFVENQEDYIDILHQINKAIL